MYLSDLTVIRTLLLWLNSYQLVARPTWIGLDCAVFYVPANTVNTAQSINQYRLYARRVDQNDSSAFHPQHVQLLVDTSVNFLVFF